MKAIRHWIDDVFAPIKPLPVGIYQSQSAPEAEKPYRLHLRLEHDGKGLLIVNAKTVLHLNQTGAEFAYHLIQGTQQEEAVKRISNRYKVGRDEALQDYLELNEKISMLVSTEDVDPESFFEMDRRDPYSTEMSAPLRLDCALTYQSAAEGFSKMAPVDRVKRELLTDEWKTILDKAWQAGIPHVIFTGGEPTLRPDLIDLIQYSEKQGMVSGLLTDGLRLAETKYLHEILQSGLDHVMLLLDQTDEQAWHALRDLLCEDIFVTVHITITRKNADKTGSLLARLKEMGVKSISISADDTGLRNELKAAQQSAADLQLSLIWDLPVPYTKFHPISLELSEDSKPIDGAGKAWLYVEPDGDVLPGQGIVKVLGNLLTDSWEMVWKKTG